VFEVTNFSNHNVTYNMSTLSSSTHGKEVIPRYNCVVPINKVNFFNIAYTNSPIY